MKQRLLYTFITFCVFATSVKSQNWLLIGNAPGSTDFLGSTNTNPLNLKTTNTTTPQPINFYTNNTLRASIPSSGGFDIAAGSGFSIGGSTVLGLGTNGTFVGLSTGSGSSFDNTIMGYLAGHGTANSSHGTTCIGSGSGLGMTSGDYNTFVGMRNYMGLFH